ncbi:hypothetical protein METBIDRAFT_76851 [Metschnikowia bicuspidata var. bicuspidata NRRL YB-4993]|uniref:Coenzyme Q-binding protein COQ10 START domain-containing protein n=1 Tax=Metschnikowia bicuspidata var. bicuspidata NRRL YB-4993 TaxID=869754 RepID=A0A1A0HIV5_9ASCO|nr:hypothetical protein METBIDRAFT_76851 [Metschnikowia bicuspidata var. bicuspidata NRRL YB-4993]OBA23936.1 hypothetical protein METBIDRAFT_76851 [Metschnikowia bicuspidata var. bicuspidata NRRL YB-4993]
MSQVIRARPLLQRRLLFGSSRGKDGFQTYRITKKISTHPDQLYLIITDVSKYEEFVPFVTSSFVNQYDPDTKLPTEAGLRVGWKQYDESFTCKLICEENKVIAESMSILLFESLYNEWNLKEVKSRFTNELSTLVELLLRYKFKNPFYNTLSSMFHNQVSNIMIKAFEERAMNLKIQSKLKDRMNNIA